MNKIVEFFAFMLYSIVTGFPYIFVGNLIGLILGIIVLAVLLILNFGWAALGWGLLTYAIIFVIGVIVAFFDPIGLRD
jgi:hypothetical protein